MSLESCPNNTEERRREITKNCEVFMRQVRNAYVMNVTQFLKATKMILSLPENLTNLYQSVSDLTELEEQLRLCLTQESRGASNGCRKAVPSELESHVRMFVFNNVHCAHLIHVPWNIIAFREQEFFSSCVLILLKLCFIMLLRSSIQRASERC